MQTKQQHIAKLRAFLTDYRTLMGLWLLIGILSAVTKLSPERHNNFLIFRGAFWHFINHLDLYAAYPAEYGDVNYYGPLFALLVAPFAALPIWAGMVLWNVALAMGMYWAVRATGMAKNTQLWVLWFTAHELLTALFMQQFNVAIAAIILLAFALVEKEKDQWATLLIMIGTLTKLYGIVGITFFLFSKHKPRFIGWCCLWLVVLLGLPMVFGGPEYVLGQYTSWFTALTSKNDLNLLALMQNISLPGLVRKIGYACSEGLPALLSVMHGQTAAAECLWTQYSDLWVLVPGVLLFALPLIRYTQWQHRAYRETVMASVLMCVCLFSTGTESSGYIIALAGVAIWFAAAPWQRNGWDIALIVLAFLLTSMSPSDLFPAFIRREYIQPLALKALPVVLVWLKLSYELMSKDYEDRL